MTRQPKRNKLDLASILALYEKFSPENDMKSQIDKERLAEILGNRQYAQQLGYPTFDAMKQAETNKLYSESRHQSAVNAEMEAAMDRPDIREMILKREHPDWPPRPAPVVKPPKPGLFDWLKPKPQQPTQ